MKARSDPLQTPVVKRSEVGGRLSHRQIEVFRAVMATGQVTRAAERLSSSQPTVSRELARLETLLGMALFDRVRGRLRPTVRAAALLEEVERSYIGLERIAATAMALRQFADGRLALACLPALAHALLPDAARRFIAAHPRAGLSITPQESPLLEQWLTEQRFDLGLIEARQAPPATRLTPLLQADEVVVLPEGHALLARRVLRPQDFAAQPFVSLAPADPYRQVIDQMFEQQGVARRMAVDAASAVSVCALVRQGLGLAIVNPLTALELAGPGLQVRPLSVAIAFHVGLVTPTLRAASPLTPKFEQCLFDAAAALQARLKALARRT
jgi:DNA-binding transcriptional LysR family regulator